MPVSITITADNLVEALRLLTVHLGAPVPTKTPESAPSSQETPQDAPIPVKEEAKPAPSPIPVKEESKTVPEYVNDIVAFRAEIKKIALPLMNEEEKALPPKEGEMALVKRLFAASGVKNSQSVDGAKREAFLKAIPQWLAKA
jgi:hypothetical protein